MCKWVCWTDQLDRPAKHTSWTDQFFLFEALASSHIQTLTFQFVHCRSFRVGQRPCLWKVFFQRSLLYHSSSQKVSMICVYLFKDIFVFSDQIKHTKKVFCQVFSYINFLILFPCQPIVKLIKVLRMQKWEIFMNKL